MAVNHTIRGGEYLYQLGDACARCDSPFAAAATLFMVRESNRLRRGYGPAKSVPICERCLAPIERELAAHFDTTAQCTGCGRQMVACVAHFRRQTCSDRCAHAAWRARQPKREPPALKCTVCRQRFTAPRADARYCSNACRQRAYRKRAQAAKAG